MACVIPWMCIILTFAGVNALVKRELNCDGTLIDGPTVFADSISCADIVTARVDPYEPVIVQECNRRVDTSVVHVTDARVSSCEQFENNTVRFQYETCCPGILDKLQCFTCTNDSVQHDPLTGQYSTHHCNQQSIDTCSDDEACMTQFNYYPNGDGGTIYEVTKGCIPRQECWDLNDNDVNTCQSDVSNPTCTSCCLDPLCNENTVFTPLNAYDPAIAGDVCNVNNSQPSPCKNGASCAPTNMPDPTYTCTCQAGFHGTNCESDSCSPHPCNGHTCRSSKEDPYYICHCSIGWHGQHCTEEYSQCEDNVCQNEGICFEQENFKRCHCPIGHFGEFCEQTPGLICSSENLYLNHSYVLRSIHGESSTTTCTSKANYVKKYSVKARWLVNVCKSKLFPNFKDGEDGDIDQMSLEQVGVHVCEHGDTIMEYTMDMCCPACLSRPCQNSGWCVQNGNDYICKCRFGFAGDHCQYETEMCVIYGDPHHLTFDKEHIAFQSICKYKAVEFEGNDTIGIPAFSVLTKYENRNNMSTVSYLSYVEVNVYGHVIRLGKDNIVTIDGAVQPQDFDTVRLADGKLTVQRSGSTVVLETDFGLVVTNDGHWISTIKVPDILGGMVTGLCGNNNDDPSDDFTTAEGVDVSGDPNSHSIVGESFQVDDLEDPLCTTLIAMNAEQCDETVTFIDTPEYCGLITDPDLDPAFKPCLEGNPDYVHMYGESCSFDVCYTKDDPDLAKESACGSLKALAEACAEKGFEVDWRTKSDCLLNCTGGTEYAFRAPPCLSTCTNPSAAKLCTQPDAELCVCPGDQVLRGDICVEPQDCGCVGDDGEHIETGTTWFTDDCTVKHTCEYCPTCPGGYGYIYSTPGHCPNYAPTCKNNVCSAPRICSLNIY